MKYVIYSLTLVLLLFSYLCYSQEPGDSISVTHSAGNADGNVYVTVDDPSQLTGHDYKVSFHTQQQIRNENGDWVPASIIKRNFNPGDPDTLTGTTIDAAAVYGSTAGTTELRFHLDVVHHYYGWVDGVILTFPSNVTIISSPPFEAGGGTVVPEIIGQEIHYGVTDGSQTQNGIFHEGGEDWIVIVASINNILPGPIDWIAFDDGYAGGQNETGTTTVTGIGYATRLAKLWNLLDVTIGELALEDISIVNGIDLFPPRDGDPIVVPNPIVDGFQINVDVSYDTPTTISSSSPPTLNGEEVFSYSAGDVWWTSDNFTICDYTRFSAPDGYAATSFSFYGGAGGTLDVNKLQKDLEFRWTGVLADTLIGGNTIEITQSGGSIVTLFGASGYYLADHPLNPNPGSNDPFTVRVPFEVWNVDDVEQVNTAFWDRSGDPTVNGGKVWNTENRVYQWIINTPYTTNLIDITAPEITETATWNVIYYLSTFIIGDVVKINYVNPIQFGVDEFTFTTPDPVVSVEDESIVTTYKLLQNYPNPFNPSTIINWQVPVGSHQNLKIYDVLGNEVATLVDEYKPAGSYEITWYAERLPSGIYFYRLQAGEFISTKKMILMK